MRLPILAAGAAIVVVSACAPIGSAIAGCNPCKPVICCHVVRHRHARHFVHHYNHVVHPAPTLTPPVTPTCPPQGCAIDLHVSFIECVVRDGHLLWRYLASNGQTYSMTVKQRGPHDMLRIHPDGRIEWAIVH